MRLVFAGTPEIALPPLRALLDSRHEVAAVVTRPDARRGRGRRLYPSAVAELATDHGIEVLRPPDPAAPDFLARLRELAPDCCPVVAYGSLLRAEALAIPPHGWVNLHFSVLPQWRGAAPVQRAIMAGDEVSGATTFRIVKQLDAGPTYGRLTERIRPDDTAGVLLDRLAEHGAGLLRDTMDGIADADITAVDQDGSQATYAHKIEVEECRVDWGLPAHLIDRHVRGVSPAPGAWTTVDGARLKLGPVTVRDHVERLAPGRLAVGKRAVLVGTGTDPVELNGVQAQGKPRMRAADWGRGLHDVPAELGT